MKHVIALALVGLCGCAARDLSAGSIGDAPTTGEEAIHNVCPNGDTTFGIDISSWQGDIDWGSVAASGVKFAIIRVADGTYHDPDYHQNWAGAKAAGVLRGTYQFFRSDVDPIVQADLLLNEMGQLDAGDLPPVADVETTDGVDNGTRAARLHQWLDHIQQATGVTPIIYTGGYFWQDNVGQDFSNYPLWHAGYTGGDCPSTVANQWPGWTFWQYSSSGSIPGIAGNVDVDRFNGSLSDLQGFANANAPPVGFLDDVNCDAGAVGWAQDPDAPAQSIAVHVYLDGPAGSGAHGFPTSANVHRDDLCAAIGSCEHGFGLPIPFAYRDNNAHTVFAYGIDSTGGNNPMLGGGAGDKTFTCAPPAAPLDAKAGVLRHVTSPDAMTAWTFSFDNVAPYSDDVIASYTELAAWPDTPGSLVRADGTVEVYLVDNDGARRWVTSPDSAAAWHFDLNTVVVQDAATVAAMPLGSPLPAVPFLLRGQGPAIYVLDAAPPDAATGEGEGAAGEGEGAAAGEGEGGANGGGEGEGGANGGGEGEGGADGGGEGEGGGDHHVVLHNTPGAIAGCGATPAPVLPFALALLAWRRRQSARAQ